MSEEVVILRLLILKPPASKRGTLDSQNHKKTKTVLVALENIYS